MPHGIIVLSPLSSNPSPLSHNPSLQTTVGQVSRPVHPSAAQTMPEAWCGELRPANPSATPTTHGKLELYCQVFVSSRAATISSFPARRAQDRSPVRQHWESNGPASAPERGGRTWVAVLLPPRSGAGKRRRPATHGSAPWATILRPSGSARCLVCGLREAGCEPAADWQSACALWKERLETVLPRPPSFSELGRKNSLVASLQVVPGRAE